MQFIPLDRWIFGCIRIYQTALFDFSFPA
uniref:Uncharacterized protein n=1 Tax=Arundo donax TaxID=35708 RepID=A0A0A9BIA9_ARUDO